MSDSEYQRRVKACNTTLDVLQDIGHEFDSRVISGIGLDAVTADILANYTFTLNSAFEIVLDYMMNLADKCMRCYNKDPAYVSAKDGDPLSDIYEICPDCNQPWGE